MLKYRNEFDKSIEKTISDRLEFSNLEKQDWVERVFNSESDFILVETKIAELINELLNFIIFILERLVINLKTVKLTLDL